LRKTTQLAVALACYFCGKFCENSKVAIFETRERTHFYCQQKRDTMNFSFFTQNLDAMGKTTKKKNLFELDDLNQIKKVEMGEFIGGNEKLTENKKKSFFAGFFGPGPCLGDLPQ